MEETKLPQELDSIISKVRLKKPSEAVLKQYSSTVDKKIAHTMQFRHGFRLSVILSGAVLAVAFAGLYYFYSKHNLAITEPSTLSQQVPLKEKAILKKAVGTVIPAKSMSVEEELRALEALDPEMSDEFLDSFDDEDLLEDYSGFDDAELMGAGFQTPLTR